MLRKIETVVIGTSLTTASDPVVRTGLKLAQAANARVVLAHAWSPHRAYAGVPYVPEMPEVVEAEKESLLSQMEVQTRLFGTRSKELCSTILAVGPAHQVLIETAQEKGADLIVAGAAEAPRLAKLFGSTADRVVRKATCPVLVVRRELPLPPARVLLPVDLSLLSGEALRQGLQVLSVLAREQGPAATLPEVEALYVITDLDRHRVDSEEDPETIEMNAREELNRFIAQHAADSAFKVVPRTVVGLVEDELLLRIREWETHLVVMGTHGRSGFERFLLGSVAARIVRDCGANVLIVPPTAARERTETIREVSQNEALVG